MMYDSTKTVLLSLSLWFFILMWLYQHVVLQCSRCGLGTSSISIAEASCRCRILSAIPEVLSHDLQFHKIPRLFVCTVMCQTQWTVFAWTGRTVSCTRKRGSDGDSAQVAVRVQYLSEKSYDVGSAVRNWSYLGIQ